MSHPNNGLHPLKPGARTGPIFLKLACPSFGHNNCATITAFPSNVFPKRITPNLTKTLNSAETKEANQKTPSRNYEMNTGRKPEVIAK